MKSATLRIIPTRVGTRAGGSDPVFVDRDHPHACGDKNLCELLPKIKGGSSPRVWGQVGSRYFQQVILRIIPTRVGTSSMISKSVPASEDHPHACGDKCQGVPLSPMFLGSSPRVWGQGPSATAKYQCQDHPHACGDKRRIAATT